MRNVDDDHTLGEFRFGLGESPCRHPAPVVADDYSGVTLLVRDDGSNIINEVFRRVVLEALGCVTEVESPQVHGCDGVRGE
jgi:hypothetical protein